MSGEPVMVRNFAGQGDSLVCERFKLDAQLETHNTDHVMKSIDQQVDMGKILQFVCLSPQFYIRMYYDVHIINIQICAKIMENANYPQFCLSFLLCTLLYILSVVFFITKCIICSHSQKKQRNTLAKTNTILQSNYPSVLKNIF